MILCGEVLSGEIVLMIVGSSCMGEYCIEVLNWGWVAGCSGSGWLRVSAPPLVRRCSQRGAAFYLEGDGWHELIRKHK